MGVAIKYNKFRRLNSEQESRPNSVSITQSFRCSPDRISQSPCSHSTGFCLAPGLFTLQLRLNDHREIGSIPLADLTSLDLQRFYILASG